MRVADRLAQREATWLELDALLLRLGGGRPGRRRGRKLKPAEVVFLDEGDLIPESRPDRRTMTRAGVEEVVRLGELYRAACADLMLAEAHDLPRDTVAYLHDLVARAHNVVYRGRGFHFRRWAGELLATVPRRLRADPMLRFAALAFYGSFLAFALVGAARPELAARVAGALGTDLDSFEQMYAAPPGSAVRDDAEMAGFYVQHNAGIGLQCFAWGLALGVMTLYLLAFNGMSIGLVFGHMARTPQAGNFYTFVTAHAPFELTAIVFAGAAGLRLGYSLIETHGRARMESLRQEAVRTLPTIGASVFLFVLAAMLEGFVSASRLPYFVKAGIALVCAGILVAYLAIGGRGDGEGVMEDSGRTAKSSEPTLPPHPGPPPQGGRG